MGSYGKYQMGGGGQRHALLLFCGKSPKLGNGTGKYLTGKGGVGHEFWVRPAGEPLHCCLLVERCGWGSRSPWLMLFCLFFHSSCEDGLFLLLLLGIPEAGLASRDTGNGRWWSHLVWALSRATRESCVFLGSGMRR
ncbi:hypothetical protein CORC01_02150 [Colletotrichum orchidophilum]|uniref:Uncharacterized protein n=1 Tax=Colletotrichum orchidophilum TaxID=1209926 RepID=A0A1G4BMA2_9PEZI|nr:uncharacterized protein CORC01_02150 [Colletotrichum orchidophilum]OHF02455.1 hypothetical protein CORC01_02150 [Colletotrichum orchidophilum]